MGGRRFAHHDFEGAESVGPAFGMREDCETVADRAEDALFGVSVFDGDGRSFGGRTDEFLVRFNMNGIELNEEGFQKLSEEISLDSIETKLDMPGAKRT